MPRQKKEPDAGGNKVKIRGGKEVVSAVMNESPHDEKFIVENPIKKQIKINQFPWTEKQKEWLGYRRKIANFKKTNVSLSKAPWEQKAEQIKKEKDRN